MKSQLIEIDPDTGKDQGQEQKEVTDKMGRWHHGLNGDESEQTPGNSEGQGSLACYIQSTGSLKVEHDLMTERQSLQ